MPRRQAEDSMLPYPLPFPWPNPQKLCFLFFIIGERAKRVRHALLLPIEKMFGRKYVKTTMRTLTILRQAEEWTRVHLREACLLIASAITKSSLYVRQNDKAYAHQITLLSLAP